MNSLQKITPCLWFDSEAEEAIDLCTSAFENSHITGILRVGPHEAPDRAFLQMKKFDIARHEEAHAGP